jgi:N-dimethylarginine dimethylaminohydrolase
VTRFLMCPPDYFGVEYEINPWMRLSVQVDRERARARWNQLHQLLTRELGATVELLPPEPGLPDLVFTANGGYVHGGHFISSAFRHPQRRREEAHFTAWFQAHGYVVHPMPPDCFFEGEGDALRLDDTIFAAYRHRSEVCSHRTLEEVTGQRVLSLELVDPWFYHLDTCFAPLGPGLALYYPAAFDDYAQRVIAQHIPHAIAVPAELARRFACNAVVVGETVVTNAGAESLAELLSPYGMKVRCVDLSEFMKSGGSAKCLVLRLD